MEKIKKVDKATLKYWHDNIYRGIVNDLQKYLGVSHRTVYRALTKGECTKFNIDRINSFFSKHSKAGRMDFIEALSKFIIHENTDCYLLIPTNTRSTMIILDALHKANYKYDITRFQDKEAFKISKLAYDFLIKQTQK